MRCLKAQSAIEYLMTYGWMLLAVAIIGTAVFTLFQKQQLDTRTVDGFEESDVGVKQINSNDNSVAAQLISKEPEDIQQATFCIYNATFSECKKVEDVLEVGETEVLEFSQFERSDSTAEYNVNVSYRSGSSIRYTEQGRININSKFTGGQEENFKAASGTGSEDDTESEVDQTLMETVEQFSTYE